MKAMIFGVTGQDGSYLAELLLSKGYEVYGLRKRDSNYDLPNIGHIKNLNLIWGDLSTQGHIEGIIHEIQPDELYNLAAQSDVRLSFDIPEYTCDITGLGVLRILEAVRKFSPKTKVYQASSSEMFGSAVPKQNENTVMMPNNPYAAAKLFAHNMCRIYRNGYDLFISCGILFNHESERRGLNFVTKKICNNIAKIKKGEIKSFSLGNLQAKRDWGYAPEYIEVMWRMLQQEKPDDFVIGTGEAHTIEEFVSEAFKEAGFDTWRNYVTIDSKLYRANETSYLCADASKAKKILGWEAKIKFNDLIKIMVNYELNK